MSTLNISGALGLGPLASAPSNPRPGVIYYDTSLGQLLQYKDGSFQEVPTTPEVEQLISDALAGVDLSAIEDRLDATEIVANAAIPATQKGAANGVATLDSNSLIPIGQIPPAALERLVIVADQTARFALTTSTVQNGDTVKQTDTNVMYFVKDDTQLGNSSGYSVYSAGTASAVAWSGVTSTPTTLSGYGITDYASAAKAAAVADSITNGITDVAPSQNAVFDALALKADASALAAKIAHVADDTTPQLGGDLDLNAKALMGDLKRSASSDASNFITEKYIHSISLSSSQTNTAISALQFAHATYEGMEITYKIKEATSNDIKIGTIRVVTNGTAVSINEISVETADTGITFTAAIVSGNVEIRYSSGSNGATMRADCKLFKA